jgi:hypothetical protein
VRKATLHPPMLHKKGLQNRRQRTQEGINPKQKAQGEPSKQNQQEATKGSNRSFRHKPTDPAPRPHGAREGSTCATSRKRAGPSAAGPARGPDVAQSRPIELNCRLRALAAVALRHSTRPKANLKGRCLQQEDPKGLESAPEARNPHREPNSRGPKTEDSDRYRPSAARGPFCRSGCRKTSIARRGMEVRNATLHPPMFHKKGLQNRRQKTHKGSRPTRKRAGLSAAGPARAPDVAQGRPTKLNCR